VWTGNFRSGENEWFDNNDFEFNMTELIFARLLNNNRTPEEQDVYMNHSVPSMVMTFNIIKASIILIGMLCNLIALAVYYYSRKVHFHQYNNSGGNYVINLTITDTVFLLLAPLELYHDINLEWPGRNFSIFSIDPMILQKTTCKAHNFVFYVSFQATSWFLAVMAFDRFLAVNRALSNCASRLRSVFYARLFSLVVWLACLIINVPVAYFSSIVNVKCNLNFGDESYNSAATQYSLMKESEDDLNRPIFNGTSETGAVCNSIYLKQDRYKSWLRIWSCLVFIAPLLIIIGCYTQVLCKVTQTIKELKKSINKNF